MTRATFKDVFAVSEFRALFAAQLVSVAGDQLARVAVSLLVYARTRSPAWTAVTYALTFLPDIVSGPLLSGAADRFSRRSVMVVADVTRVVLVAGMAWPGMPLPGVAVLLVAVQMMNAPWTAARAALLPQVLPGNRFVVGMAVFTVTTQTAQVLGFALGGLVVAAVSPNGALWVDAGTFACSALLVWHGVRDRSLPGQESRVTGWFGLALVLADVRLKALVALGCVSGFYIAGEAVVAPYAAGIGGGAVAVGLLLAAYSVGNVVGVAVVARLVPERRRSSLVPLAILSCAPLTVCLAHPGLAVTMLLFACSGAAGAYNLTASTLFVQSVPDAQRGRTFGIAVTALRVSQGIGVVGAGIAAEYVAPHIVVAFAGLLGMGFAARAGWSWRRAGQDQPA
ncbi:MFS transporter [Actinocrispum wychmicini]|uniref:Putative MFS family arabinose efflux permease n=1 Tax=Actinocrispum wychmicini TaxID=1213861 RepID=A0A4R2J8J0_9PSEU|nr:MFS transporter [Actinocrispum wychmicini]TCO54944.1 putative MFS family arabinose efflux permease [Actinocrispum wychmicini]